MSEQRIRMLLVEDNDDDVVFIREAFNGGGRINVEQIVQDGDEALAYLRGEEPYHNMPTPDLILLDLRMPKKDGFQVLEEIKQDARLKHIPVVVLTVSTREADMVNAYSKGAASYICKKKNFSCFRTMIKIFEDYWIRVAGLPTR
jgi:CheY-like chemotaxis protein